jgi:cation:H+ antiporter
MSFTVLQFIAGLLGLAVGASLLVRGASALALRLGISRLVVGLTVVALGTSAPETAVSSGAVLAGRTGLAVGNAIGSNIFNVLFILGLAALVKPLPVHRQVIRQDGPLMVVGAVLLILMAQDGVIGLGDASMLLGLLIAYTAFLVRQSRAATAATRHSGAQAPDTDPGPDDAWDSRLPAQLILIASGLALLVLGSDALVQAAAVFAHALGMSDAVIGLTIVAAGTSLPEVAATVAAGLKGERDIAVGNVVGSCVFNSFGVIGLAGLVAALSGAGALPVPPDQVRFDLWVMLAAMVACLPIFLSGRTVGRWEGLLLLSYYVAYSVYLVMAQQGHAGTGRFADAIVHVVAPLTALWLATQLRGRRTS